MNLKPVTQLVALIDHDLNGYSDEAQARKESFHRLARRVAKLVAEAMGLPPGSYDVRSNKAGSACSGEVTLHGERIYIQFGQGVFRDRFMFRSCEGRKDYTGGPNQWMGWRELGNDFFGSVGCFRAAAGAFAAAQAA